MAQKIDMTGSRFHRWTVIREVLGRGRPYWLCECECGNRRAIDGNSLRKGTSKSCGCFKVERTKQILSKHGRSGSRVYNIWADMKTRCYNSKSKNWKHYGHRGISVCQKWQDSFEAFLADVGEPPSPKHSIDRINNNGDYEPGNVRWATQRQQHLNRRVTITLTYRGVTRPLYEWAEIIGMSPKILANRRHKGWSDKQIIETDYPAKPGRKPK